MSERDEPRQNTSGQCGGNVGEYGRAPAMRALPLMRYLNTLPMEERAAAAAAFVRRRLEVDDAAQIVEGQD